MVDTTSPTRSRILPQDRAVFDDCVELARKREAKPIAVVLECEEEENLWRLRAAGRVELLKLTNEEVLRASGIERENKDLS